MQSEVMLGERIETREFKGGEQVKQELEGDEKLTRGAEMNVEECYRKN